MSTETFTTFFAILSLITWAGTLTVLVLALIRRRSPDSSAAYFFDDVRSNAVPLAFAVALVTTLGSLYLSEIAHYHPCPLCWYQRICMYPLVVALIVGWVRRDREVYAYVLPPAIIGAGFAIYHTQLQAFPKQHGPFCKGIDPCTVRYVWKFGFVSVPFMSLAAFAFIITMMFVLRSGRSDEEVEPETLEAPSPADERSLAGQGVS
jgi:disulfide bond formation protein DsbB